MQNIDILVSVAVLVLMGAVVAGFMIIKIVTKDHRRD